MEALPAVALLVPLIAAAALVGVGPHLPRWALDGVAAAAALATAAIGVLLAVRAEPAAVVSWAGGWRPRGGVAVGIALVADPASAGLVALAGVLVAVAFLAAWRHRWAVEALFQPLMLLLLGGMTGFLFSGDLFNLYVFLELMSVAAYGLTAYQVHGLAPLQGAVNFAVTGSLGAVLLLLGIGLTYARGGTLDLAELGRRLDRPDPLLAGAFALLAAGFLVKAGAVPFHFAQADAHAVAPTPALIPFSGLLLELGVYGLVRVWTTAFSAALPPGGVAGTGLLAAGTVTAAVGAAMCWRQGHLKRLLAYSTLSHVGLLLVAAGIAGPAALSGMLLYLVGHAAAKGALFVGGGILLDRTGRIDEGGLHGRGRRLPLTGAGFALAAFALAGAPPFATFYGNSGIEQAAAGAGRPWVEGLLVAVSGVTAGAALRACGRIFLGWGATEAERRRAGGEEPEEVEGGDEEGEAPSRWPMTAALAVLVAVALAAGVAGGPRRWATAAGRSLADRTGYAAAALDDRPAAAAPEPAPDRALAALPAAPPEPVRVRPTASALRAAAAALALALGAALLGLRVLPGTATVPRGRPWATVWLEALHTGQVGDQVAWLAAGFGVWLAVLLLS